MAITTAPAALSRIEARAAALGFDMSSDPKVGALLATLAASKPRGRSLELGTGAGVGAAWLLHVASVLPEMPAAPIRNTWLVWGGWPFVVDTAHLHFLAIAPRWGTAALLPWLAYGLWANGERVVLAVVAAYSAAFVLAGRPDNWYWGFLTVHLWPLGVPSPARGR